MKAKIFILFSVCIAACVNSFAQVRTDINLKDRNNSSYDVNEEGFNANSFSVGVGLGSSKLYGDLSHSNPQPVYIAYFEKNFSPFIMHGQQLSIGDLSSNDPHTHMRSFNHFTSLDEHITVELGVLLKLMRDDYKDNTILSIAGGIYAGVGVGIINNDVKRIANVDQDHLIATYASSNPIILQNSMAMYIPINAGINVHINKLLCFKGCIFNANFQYSDCFSDYIDGYKLPYSANKKNDIYTVMSVGFKFYINHANSAE